MESLGWRRKINEKLFRRLYLEGRKMSVIAEIFGVTIQALKQVRRDLELPVRKSGYTHTSISKRPRITLKTGDVVVIRNGIPSFDGMLAIVHEPTLWGAHLRIPVFRYSKLLDYVSYRVLYEEMDFVGNMPPVKEITSGGSVPTISKPTDGKELFMNSTGGIFDPQPTVEESDEAGTGMFCPDCGSEFFKDAGRFRCLNPRCGFSKC